MIDTSKAALIMMVGIPASGKSYIAEQIALDGESKVKSNVVIHSSDKLREELYNDVNNQENNVDLFVELHKRIKADLKNGKIVIYDATNINKKRRKEFLKEIKNIDCTKICVPILSPYQDCINRNNSRERSIPEKVITKMYRNYQPPSLDEGFDTIVLMYNLDDDSTVSDYTLFEFFHGKTNACEINQENHHHTMTVGDHCLAVYRYLQKKYPDDVILQVAGLLHDVGKPSTKTNKKPDGSIDTECHYYHHNNVGAYDSFFYTMQLDLNYDDRIKVANLIYYHMLPLTSWRQSEKAERRFQRQMGEEMYQNIKKLNEADVYEHKEV